MGKVTIVYDKKLCIGAGECAVVDKSLWHMGNDSKAILKDAVLKDGKYHLEIDESQLKKQQTVAGSCPTGAIKILK
jgi:ferredoxin